MPNYVLTAEVLPFGVPSEGSQWIHYHVEVTRGPGNIDWAVVQNVDGVIDGVRLYHTTNKSGDANLTAPTGATGSAFVVELENGGLTDPLVPISNTVTFTTP